MKRVAVARDGTDLIVQWADPDNPDDAWSDSQLRRIDVTFASGHIVDRTGRWTIVHPGGIPLGTFVDGHALGYAEGLAAGEDA